MVFFADANGYIWANQSRDGIDVAAYNFQQGIFFTSTDCSGTAYVSASPPRVTFRLGGEAAIHAAADNVAPVTITVGSIGSVPPTTCSQVSTGPFRVVPHASTLPTPPLVVPTSLPGVQPIHPEFVP